MLKEFKTFIAKGSVLDLAVGIIIGGAFGKITQSLVKDVLMPPLGMLLGGVKFSEFFISLNGGHYDTLAAAQEAGAPTLNYGLFINTVVEFVILGFAIFLLVKLANRIREQNAPKPAPAAPTTKECPQCLSTIPLKATRCAHCTSEVA